jgi:hypothetical protein
LTGDIKDIQVYDTLIFILDDKNKLFVFNKDGKFRNYIGKTGNGPGEYLAIRAFCVDKFSRQIIVFDNMNYAYFLYDIDGTFKSKINIESNYNESPMKMMMINQQSLLVYYALYKENTAYKLFDFLSQKEIQTKHYQYANCTSFIYSFSKHPITVSENNTATIIMPLCDTLFQCSNNELISKYIIQHSNQIAPIVTSEFNREYNPVTLGIQYTKDGLFTGFNGIFEIKDKILLYIGFIDGGNLYFIVDKNKMDGSYHVFSSVGNINSENINSNHTSHKELTCMPFFKPSETDGNYLVSYVMPYNLINLQGKINSEQDANLSKLNNLVNTVNEEDNPVLFFYKLK